MIASRREVLARLGFGCLFIPAILRAPRSVLGTLLFDPEAPLVPAKLVPSNPFVRDGKAVVAMVHGRDVPAMLQEGLRLLGGLDRLPLAGTRVLLKPNVVNDRPPPATTSPALVAAAVAMARSAGAADVTVGDSSGIIRFPTSGNLKATGIQAAAEQAGARVRSLDEATPQPWVRVEPPQAKALPTFYVSRLAYEADVLINLPVIKTHRFAHYSCCLKNLVGLAHPRNRPSVTFLMGDWHERIAELNLAVPPQLHIADGTTVMIAGGPTSGTAAQAMCCCSVAIRSRSTWWRWRWCAPTALGTRLRDTQFGRSGRSSGRSSWGWASADRTGWRWWRSRLIPTTDLREWQRRFGGML